jgi:hypothetical protein
MAFPAVPFAPSIYMQTALADSWRTRFHLPVTSFFFLIACNLPFSIAGLNNKTTVASGRQTGGSQTIDQEMPS